MTLMILILYTWAFNYYTFKYHEHMQTTLTIFYRKLNIKKMELPVNRFNKIYWIKESFKDFLGMHDPKPL